MGKLLGPLEFTGSVGNLVYYKVGEEIRVRRKPVINKQRLKTHPDYEATRECNELWAKANRIVKVLFSWLPKKMKAGNTYGELVGIAYKILNNEETERKVRSGVLKEIERMGARLKMDKEEMGDVRETLRRIIKDKKLGVE
jgi:hypothetical protein